MKNPTVDAYIERAAEFAQPILKRIRKLFHQACPKIEETIKWGFPNFEYQGIVGNMAAFKNHCSLGFWKAKELREQLGDSHLDRSKITAVDDLPEDAVLVGIIRAAVAINEAGLPTGKQASPKPKAVKKAAVEVPDFLTAALKKNKNARETFESLSPSHRREYVEWLTEAKRDDTRARRLATALEWLAEGKTRNWKYERK